MALGTFTLVASTGGQPSAPLFLDEVSFPGDSSYSSGGTTGFLAKYQALTKSARTPIAVFSADSAFTVSYDPATDKLKIYDVDNAAEVSGDIHTTTFKVYVLAA